MASPAFYEALAGTGNRSLARAVLYGVISGIAGAIGFGLFTLVYAPTMIMGIGNIVGANSVLGGWAYHLFNGAVIGAIFGLVLARVCTSYRVGLLWGLGYGLLWWVLGGQVLFPLMMGYFTNILNFNPANWVGLVAHIIFGLITGLGTTWLTRLR